MRFLHVGVDEALAESFDLHAVEARDNDALDADALTHIVQPPSADDADRRVPLQFEEHLAHAGRQLDGRRIRLELAQRPVEVEQDDEMLAGRTADERLRRAASSVSGIVAWRCRMLHARMRNVDRRASRTADRARSGCEPLETFEDVRRPDETRRDRQRPAASRASAAAARRAASRIAESIAAAKPSTS